MTEATRKDSATGPTGLWQARYLQVVLMFFGFSMAYALRICMSVAIVPMMDSSTANPDFKEYDWDSTAKGYIQSSFFWGYVLTQLPAGYVAKYWNANNFMSIGVGLCAVVSIFTPIAADAGWGWVCACRAIMGLFQGSVLPCMHTLLAKWAPNSERARLVTLTYSGPYFGTMVANALSGVLAESSGGWPSIFYVFGGLSLLWAILFYVFGADSPGKHTFISDEERRYIESSLGNVQNEKSTKKLDKTPWKEIFTSVPVWALVSAHCGQNWGFWVIITEISSFMSAILGFDMAENGFKAALPYLTMLILAFPASWLSDYALKKGVSKVVLRKSANTISQWGPAIALLVMCFVERGNTTLPVVIFIIAVAANVGATCGFQMNHIDLSPNNAGILMSITNCFAAVVAMIAPLVVSAIVTDENGFKASLPYLTMLILAFPASWLSDYALKKGVGKAVLRKSANTVAQWVPAVALVVMCFVERGNTTLPVVIFIIAVAANVGSTCGFHMNHMDLSPNNAGVLMSITNFFAAITALLAPLVASAIVTDEKDFSQWQIVFYLSAVIYFVCNSIFLLLGSTERQWWDDPDAVRARKNGLIVVEPTGVLP